MSADANLGGMFEAASAVEAPAVETPAAVATETPAAASADTDLAIVDASSEQHEEESTEDGAGKGKETETQNADGTEKTPEQIEDFKAKAAGREPLPQEVRTALKALKELDPKNAAVVKTLHGAFERYTAIKDALGAEGPNGLKSYLQEVGAKNITEARATLARTQEVIDTVAGTDQLLYEADPVLATNVFEDMRANGSEKNYGKVVQNFVEHLKSADPSAYYDEVAKPLTLAGMDEAGLPTALNNLHKALVAGDTEKAKGITKAIADFYIGLREETGEKAKISKERAAWETERTSKETESQKAERTKVENNIAEGCEKLSNTILGKSLGGFLKLPFFKDFPYETKVDIGNGIKDRLYATLKADKSYQSSMKTLWASKTLDRAKMEQVHQEWLTQHGLELVRGLIQSRYPGYAKGGSAAGKAAAATATKTAAAKAGAASVATGKPIYVASRPENLIRNDVKIGGRTYTANDLQVLQISGKGFVKTTDGKGVKFVTWRR